MKSREEYQASIFAKRDALLAKRKKRISYLTTAGCIVICFLTAFFLVPKDKFKVKSDPNDELLNSHDHSIYEITPEDYSTLPVDDGTAGFVEEAEGFFRENETTPYFGGNDAAKAENIQSCTVASSVPQQAISSSTTKATKTTTKKNHSENNTDTNDVVGAGNSIIDVEDVIDGIDSLLPDNIEWPELTTRGNILQGFFPEGVGPVKTTAPSTQVPPVTTEIPATPNTGGDDLSGVLDAAHAYLSENELKEIDPSKTEISIEGSPTDSMAGSSSDEFVYYVSFQTDTETIIIILDIDTLEFLGREEQPLTKTSVESTTAPQTTHLHETTTVTQTVTENN